MIRRLFSTWTPEPSQLLADASSASKVRAGWLAFGIGLATLAGAIAWPFGLYGGVTLQKRADLASSFAVSGLLLTILLPLAVRYLPRPGGVRVVVVTRVALALTGLAFAAALVTLWRAPAYQPLWGDVGEAVAVVGGAEGLAFGVAMPFALVVAWLLVGRDRPRADAALAYAAKGALALALGLVVLTGARAWVKRDATTELEGLQHVASLAGSGYAESGGGDTPWQADPLRPATGDVVTVGDVTVRRACPQEHGRCTVTVSLSGAPPAGRPIEVSTYSRLGVARDPVRGLVRVTEYRHNWLFTTRDGRTVLATRADLAGHLALPLTWLVTALAGLLLAAFAQAHRRQVLAVYHAPEAWRGATLDEGGWIRFTDSTPPRLAAASIQSYRGPVVVIPTDETSGGAYRDDGGPRDGWVVAGTVDSLREAVRATHAAVDAFTLAAALVGAAPLLAAALAGAFCAW